jgi:hypothetical protein
MMFDELKRRADQSAGFTGGGAAILGAATAAAATAAGADPAAWGGAGATFGAIAGAGSGAFWDPEKTKRYLESWFIGARQSWLEEDLKSVAGWLGVGASLVAAAAGTVANGGQLLDSTPAQAAKVMGAFAGASLATGYLIVGMAAALYGADKEELNRKNHREDQRTDLELGLAGHALEQHRRRFSESQSGRSMHV